MPGRLLTAPAPRDISGSHSRRLTVQDPRGKLRPHHQDTPDKYSQKGVPGFGRAEAKGWPLSDRIRSGRPYSCALGRLSQLSVWWLRLGIRPELIEPASPQQNGRHERMHKDLKAETAQPEDISNGVRQGTFLMAVDRAAAGALV